MGVSGYLWFMVYFNLNANLNLDCKVTQKAHKTQKVFCVDAVIVAPKKDFCKSKDYNVVFL